MTQVEFESLLEDTTKRIDSDIIWSEDEDHSPAVEFRSEVISDPGYPLFVCGSYNSKTQRLSYVLIYNDEGRIYGLCLGSKHHNPSCEWIGEKHKHRWNEQTKDKEAYVPVDITKLATDPVDVWKQFCVETRIMHNGRMYEPP